jgi:hypothetical protein
VAPIPIAFHPSTAPAQPDVEGLTNVFDGNIYDEEQWDDGRQHLLQCRFSWSHRPHDEP